MNQLLPGIVAALQSSSQTSTGSPNCSSGPSNSTVASSGPTSNCTGSQNSPSQESVGPSFAGADRLPDLTLPKNVLTTIDKLIGAGGVVLTSSNNLTLYNLRVRMRLLGGPVPHDELLSPNQEVPSSWSSWRVEVQAANFWVPMAPLSNDFTSLGTNATGTFVVRTMQVRAGPHSGTLAIIYKALSTGSLKWDLQFTSSSSATYRFVHNWANLTQAVNLMPLARQFQVGYGSANYTLSWDDVPNGLNATASIDKGYFSLSIYLGRIVAGSSVSVDPRISTSTSSSATGFTFQRKVFYEPSGGYYFAFYFDGVSVGYSSSRDGSTWSAKQPLAPGWPSYSFIPEVSFPSVINSGRTVLIAAGEARSSTNTCNVPPCTFSEIVSLYVANGTITGPSISWQNAQWADRLGRVCRTGSPGSCPLNIGIRYVNMAADANGVVAFSYNWYGSSSSGEGLCTWGATSESVIVVVYNGQRFFVNCESGLIKERSIIVPSSGGATVVYTAHTGTRVQLFSRTLSGSGAWLPNVAPVADTYTMTSSLNATTNYGGSRDLWVGSDPNSWTMSWMKFNLPTIPANAQFSQAKVVLTFSSNSWRGYVSSSDVIEVSGARGSWSETGLTWANQPGMSDIYTSLSPGLNCGFGCTGTLTLDITPTIWGFYNNFFVNWGIVVGMPFACCNSDYVLSSREGPSPPQLQVHYNCCIGPPETIDPNIKDGSGFSATSDGNYGAHVAYRSWIDGNVTYAYRAPSGSSWSWTKNIFAGRIEFPTLTADVSTNDIYAFGVAGPSNSSIIMKRKPLSGAWNDNAAVFPVTGRISVSELASNAASASTTNSSSISLIWTEGMMSPYNVTFASIPIQIVWSPYSSPADPWDSNGLAPYSQYFANLGESVSPYTGMLTVRQTDLSVSGRGLNLEVTRVYAEPYSFLNGNSYNYEIYPWAPLGKGWQLNFPWLSNMSSPSYIHLWDGQGYRIPSSFWTGTTVSFENHQGEHFRLARNSTGIFLYGRSGISYKFDTSFKLAKFMDPIGNNITFSYTNNRISSITDTLGRIFQFCHTGGLLAAIYQTSGTCLSPGTARSIAYSYVSSSLSSVTDPGGRVTYYSYNATIDASIAPWLLSRIRYPTQWYSNYTYRPVVMGTQASTYRVYQQIASSPTSSIRRFDYKYSQLSGGDQVTNSTIQTFDGSSGSLKGVGFTRYSFSFAGVTMNITDAAKTLVRGVQQRFGVNGEVPREVILVTDGSGLDGPGHVGSYTNYYRYDLWGNLIYSRKAISPSANWYHESFNTYYNTGLSLGFYAFQDTFSQGNYTRPDEPWNAISGNWITRSGIAFKDPSFNLGGWTTESSGVTSPTQTPNGETDQLTATFTAGAAGYYRIVNSFTTSIDGNLYSKVVVRLKSTVTKNLLKIELKDGTTFFQPTDGSGDLWKKSTSWTTAVLNLQGHSSINTIRLGISSESDTTISGTQSGYFDYAFIANDVPAGQDDGLGQYSGVPAGGYEEKVFAWSNINKTDISLQARIFIGQQVNFTGPRVGLFTHYPGTGENKWALVVRNQTAGVTLSLLEEYVAWRADTSCSVTTKNWYTLNFTTRGTYATGWLSGPNGLYCTVSGSFGGGSLSTATGYGLYAGAYSTLFDNVVVATVGPSITAVGFSDSFYPNGAPGPNLHGFLAGTAELTNSTGIIYPEETYFGYYSWGGLSQTKQRSDAPVAVSGSSSPALDGSNQLFCNNTTTSCSTTLSTTHTNDIIVVFAFETLDQQTSCSFSVSDTAGLTWMKRSGVVFGRFDGVRYRDQLQEFWARSPGLLSSDTITESISGCGSNYNGLQVFAISGANFYNPFDPSPTLPASASGNSAGTSVTMSTVNTNEMVFAGVQHGSPPVPTPQTGFTTIVSASGMASEYKAFSMALTNYAVTFGDTASDYWEQIADAIQPAPTTTTQWLTTSKVYDVYGNLKTQTDRRSNTAYYTFSAGYNYAYLTNQTLIDGSTKITALYAYNFTTGNVQSKTDPMNDVTSYQNDDLGRAKRIVYPVGAYVNFTYNDQANYVDIVNENKWKTRQFYDGLGRQTIVDRFLNGASYSNETYSYNWQNKVITHTDQLGSMTRTQYDVLGRVTNQTMPNGKSILTTYNDIASWVVSADEETPVPNYKCSVYDRLGRLMSVVEKASTDCQTGIVTNYYYNEVGNLAKVTNALSKSTFYSFDNLGQLIQTAFPDKTSETYAYDNNGNIITKLDRNGVQTSYTYDSLNRAKTISYGSEGQDSYIYDKNGNLLQLIGKNATLTYTYDSRNRVLTETYDVNGGTVGGSVAYGTLVTLADRTAVPVQNLKAGMQVLSYNTTSSQYEVSTITRIDVVITRNMLIIDTQDPLPLRVDNSTAQKLWVKKSDGTIGWISVTQIRPLDYLYNAMDQRWTMVKRIGLAPRGIHVMYDIFTAEPHNYIANNYLDPVKERPGISSGFSTASVSQTYMVTYAYNGELLDNMTYPTLSVTNIGVKYSYDGLGRILTVTKSGSPGTYYARSFTYYKNDLLKGLQFGNNLVGNYTYDSLGRPQTITLSGGLMSLTYAYNNTGTVATITGNVNGVNVNEQYKYDQLQRLTNSTVISQGTTTTLWYEYDNVGNRLRQKVNTALTSFSYNQTNNELTSSSAPGLSLSYAYNPDGTLKTRTITGNSTTWAYSWDVAGNLLKVTRGGANQGRYAYDGMGRLVESIEASTAFFAYMGTETLFKNISGSYSIDYLYAGGLRIATVDSSSGSYTSASSPKYFHTDHLGSTRIVTSWSGSVVFSDSFQPFGQDNGTPTGSETYKFTGKPFSQPTDLYYHYHRWYDPSIGRFISSDGSSGLMGNPQSLNGYTYAYSNPVLSVDPDGDRPISFLELFLRGASGLASGYYLTLRRFKNFYNLNIRMPGRFGDSWRFRTDIFHFNTKTGNPLTKPGHTLVEAIDSSRGDRGWYIKLDAPDVNDPYYHLGWGDIGDPLKHREVPEWFGRLSEFNVRYGRTISRATLVIAVAASAFDIYSGYQADVAQGTGFHHTAVAVACQAGGWAGAWAGAEAGAWVGGTIGLAAGGVGALIGAPAGALVGGIGGFYGGCWAGQTIAEGLGF